jgi:hypothetical protein
LLWANTGLGFAIALVQWDVARFNTTQRHSWVTAAAMRAAMSFARGIERRRVR